MTRVCAGHESTLVATHTEYLLKLKKKVLGINQVHVEARGGWSSHIPLQSWLRSGPRSGQGVKRHFSVGQEVKDNFFQAAKMQFRMVEEHCIGQGHRVNRVKVLRTK